jgi:hypothetical protein
MLALFGRRSVGTLPLRAVRSHAVRRAASSVAGGGAGGDKKSQEQQSLMTREEEQRKFMARFGKNQTPISELDTSSVLSRKGLLKNAKPFYQSTLPTPSFRRLHALRTGSPAPLFS